MQGEGVITIFSKTSDLFSICCISYVKVQYVIRINEYSDISTILIYFSHFCVFQDFATQAKVAVQKLIQRVGFFGILACASVSKKKSHLIFSSSQIFVIIVIMTV